MKEIAEACRQSPVYTCNSICDFMRFRDQNVLYHPSAPPPPPWLSYTRQAPTGANSGEHEAAERSREWGLLRALKLQSFQSAC